ncbi:cytoplasmic dynein 2 heavy chain 1-like [Haliotis cracherodii]|uniref:cytoplasmic dynein 2 heavy chain 1-like n=1 Tax=Haliotis cracherodii TaxID=6455 RepID=UPI0039E8DB49
MSKGGNTVIDKNDITEIKSLSNPPQLVKELLTVTLLLLGYPEKEAENYNTCRRVVADTGKDGLQQQMMNKDASSIPPDTVAKVRAKLQEHSVERAKKVSLASAGLYTWAAKMTA